MQTRTLRVEVSLGVAQRIGEFAKRPDRSRGSVVEDALGAWIHGEEQRHRLTMEALAGVDAGRVIDNKTVQAWPDSLDTAQTPLPPS